MSPEILTDLCDGILTVTMNRPEKKNALSIAMYAALARALNEADRDPLVRVVLIAGSEECFTSGNDLADFLNDPPEGEQSPVFQFLLALTALRKPLVAAVGGAAVGVGTTLLLHCDLVYAGARALFSLPFVNLGLCPEAGSTLLLTRMLGHPRAAELLLLGEPFKAARAKELGIVNEVVPESELMARAREAARKLAARPPAALRIAKGLLKRADADLLREAMARESVAFLELLKGPEAAEALTAFMERRKPDFSRFD